MQIIVSTLALHIHTYMYDKRGEFLKGGRKRDGAKWIERRNDTQVARKSGKILRLLILHFPIIDIGTNIISLCMLFVT